MSQGLQYATTPGQIEYKRTGIDIGYLPRVTPCLFFAGEVAKYPKMAGQVSQASQEISLATRVIDQVEFDWFEHDTEFTASTTFVTGSLAAGTRGTPKIYTVADASILRPGHVCLNPRTNEQFRVVSINTTAAPDEVTMYPAFYQTAGTTGTTFPGALVDGTSSANLNGDTLLILGYIAPEGSSFGDIIYTDPTRRLQYTAVIRKDMEETNSSRGTSKLANTITWEERRKQKLVEAYEELETLILFSKLNKSIENGKPVRAFQGVRDTIQTNVVACSALVGGGDDLSYPKISNLSQIAYAGENGRPSKRPKVCLAGGTIMRKVDEICRTSHTINVDVGNKVFGIESRQTKHQFGSFEWTYHSKMDKFPEEILIIDRDEIELAVLRGENGKTRDLSFKMLSENGNDSLQGYWIGEYAPLVKNEKCFVRVTGVVPTFS